MADLIFNKFRQGIADGSIDLDSDTFYGLFVTSTYTPDVDAHEFRDDITNELAAGSGYTQGGQELSMTLTRNDANDRMEWSYANEVWSAFSAGPFRAMIIYKNRGGAASLDELCAYVDFGTDQTGGGGNFTVQNDTPLYIN